MRRVLAPQAFVHAAALGAIVAFAELDAPTVVLLVCGFLAGFAIPPTSAVLRSLWPDLVEPGLQQAAFALDSTMIELIFISGPLLTALIAAVASPAGALIVSAVAVVTGTTVFTGLPAVRAVRPEERHERHLLGALGSPGVRTLVLASAPTGVGIGMLEVGIPAFSRAHGAAAAAGVLLAMWSFGSGIGGLLYGTLPRRAGLHRTHLLVGAAMPLTLLPLAFAPSVPAMALLVLPAGCCIAPLLATRNELVERGRAARDAHRGVHLARHLVRRRDRRRRGAGRLARRGAGLADGVPRGHRVRRRRRGPRRDLAAQRGSARDRVT